LYGIVNLTQGERKLATRQKQSPFRHLADFGGKAMTMIKRDSAHPFSLQDVVGLSLAETIIIPRHLQTPEIRAFINLAPLTDLRNPDTPAPTAADESGRSAQIFLVDVVVRKGEEERRAVGTRARHLRDHCAHCGGSDSTSREPADQENWSRRRRRPLRRTRLFEIALPSTSLD
jgi:hypothetical protein